MVYIGCNSDFIFAKNIPNLGFIKKSGNFSPTVEFD